MSERIIYHVDVNSAFLSWEAAYRIHVLGESTDLRKIPSVIGGDEQNRHGIVLAKSELAKNCGIHTGESLYAARQKCPSLLVVPPRYDMYVGASRALMELLRQFSPKVEQYSIDEAFMDMSGCDLLYGSPVIAANHIKDLITEKFHFTVNIGISSNKLLAKMAGELRKPNLVHTLFPEEIPKKMWPLSVGELFFVGRVTKHKLRMLGIRTIGELAHANRDILYSHLKKQGETIYQFANGKDSSPLFVPLTANKGYGNSITTPYDVTNMESARLVLLSLCETVCSRLRKDNVRGSVISVSFTDNSFVSKSHQRTLFSATSTTSELYIFAYQLLKHSWDEKIPLRQLGVHVTKITREEGIQYNLFSGDRYERMGKLEKTIDQIRSRYGEESVIRASFLDEDIYHMGGGTCRERRNGITKPLQEI